MKTFWKGTFFQLFEGELIFHLAGGTRPRCRGNRGGRRRATDRQPRKNTFRPHKGEPNGWIFALGTQWRLRVPRAMIFNFLSPLGTFLFSRICLVTFLLILFSGKKRLKETWLKIFRNIRKIQRVPPLNFSNFPQIF